MPIASTMSSNEPSWLMVTPRLSPGLTPFDGFGGSVSASGDTAVIAAAGDEPAGSAYVFDLACGGCPEDINGDGTVNVLDLLAVLAAWGQSGVPEDINGDGTVNVFDLLEVLAAWGPCS